MSFLLFNLILLGIVIVLLIFLSWIWPPDSPWAPWWRTNKKIARAMCRLAKVREGEVVYDLGSGDGTALIIAAKEFGAKSVGIEIDLLRYLVSILMIRIIKINGKVVVKRKNFFDEDFSKAAVIYTYLVPKALKKLLPKFKKELKPGVRIVSLRYKIDLPLKIHDKEHNLRLYEI